MTSEMMAMREYLSEIRIIKIKIERKQERLKELEDRAVYTTTAFGGIGVSHGYDNKRENLLIKLMDNKAELLQEIEDMAARQDKIYSMIDSIKDPDIYRVMTNKYMYGYDWDKMACSMGKSLQWCHELHRRGLAYLCNNYKIPA